MTIPGRLAVLVAALGIAAGCGPALAAPTAKQAPAGALVLQVIDVTPRAPARSATIQPLRVTIALTNTTANPVSDVQITGRRGDPLDTQSSLDELRSDTTPRPSGIDIATDKPVRVDVPDDGKAHRVVFDTTYGVPRESGVCQCAPRGVYPLFFTASTSSADGGTDDLATTVTFLPSFLEAPEPVRVGWVWPLIDHPHRLDSQTSFLDDTLSTDVAPGGRLDHSLNTVERVAGHVPITLVADPELLDELSVMATGKYTVSAGPGIPSVAGVGADAAQSWLSRLTALLGAHPEIRIVLTPYADPDITSVSLLKLDWQYRMPSQMTTNISNVLGGRPLDYSVSWPASGAYPAKTLTRLADQGVRSTLLPSTDVVPRDGADDGIATGSAQLRAGGHTVSTALLSPTAQADAADALTPTSTSSARLSDLLAEIAIRAAAHPQATQSLVLTPPRYVDPDPATAARTILETSSSPFSRPVSLSGALAARRSGDSTSKLAAFPSSAATLAASVTSPVADVITNLGAVTSMLTGGSAAADTLVAGLPLAVQRSESSAWLVHPADGTALATRLADKVDGIVNGVRIVRPASQSGTYTLASGNSALPITVDNRLGYPVRVRVQVRADNGLPGFRLAKPVKTQRLGAHVTSTLKLQTSIDRSGRIPVEAQLHAPDGKAIGEQVSLTVHSTALGTVGVVITVVATAVLALALLVRLLRRLSARRRRPRTPTPGIGTGSDNAGAAVSRQTAEPAA